MKKFLFYIVIFSISFVVDFSILYYFGTKDIGLCSSISFIMSGIVSTVVSQNTEIFERVVKSVVKSLLPSFEQLDGHINGLYERTQNQDEKIDELETKINELEFKVSELENEIEEIKNPRNYSI